MEIASGVISLTWDVFDSTVRIFKFITALVEMPRECEMYRLQLIMEYNRVLAWGKAAGLVDVPEGSSLAVTLGTDSIELVAIVARIQWLLSEFRDLNSRYNNEVFPTSRPGENGDEKQPTDLDVLKDVSSLAMSYEAEKKERRHRRGTNHLRGFFGKTKEVITHPARVRWVAIDKEAFEALLTDLHALTERLHELMRTYRERRIDDITAKTYREMILARNNIQELKDMFDAVTGLISTSTTTRNDQLPHHNAQTLQDLIQLKKIARTSETILSQPSHPPTTFNLTQTLTLSITVPQFTDANLSEIFEWNEPSHPNPELLPRPRGILSTSSPSDNDDEIPVWIEWKPLNTNTTPNSRQDFESTLRTIALAQMLHLPKPASLHAPECVGYFDDREVSGAERYGWVFKMPRGCGDGTRVVSLYEMLEQGKWGKPSLGERVGMARRLCETVVDLHAVNWLHKGIFSENVVFFVDDEDQQGEGCDTEKMVLSGFEFSRPDGTHTTARDVDVVWDLYRWPGIQRERPTERNSRKTYDLYSLGLVLLEIAHWERLSRLMCLGEKKGESGDEKVPNVSLEESKRVRDWLLGVQGGAPFEAAGKPNPVRELRNVVGDRYWRAVERCLWAHGDKGFGVEELAEQSNDSSVGILLQEAFTEHVVEQLRSVHI